MDALLRRSTEIRLAVKGLHPQLCTVTLPPGFSVLILIYLGFDFWSYGKVKAMGTQSMGIIISVVIFLLAFHLRGMMRQRFNIPVSTNSFPSPWTAQGKGILVSYFTSRESDVRVAVWGDGLKDRRPAERSGKSERRQPCRCACREIRSPTVCAPSAASECHTHPTHNSRPAGD